MAAPSRPDALIFDLDGTLWDTCETCAEVWNRVLGRLQIPYRPISAADVRSVTGRPHTEGIREIFTDLTEEQIQRISAETQVEDNVAIARDGGEMYAGVREFIPRLSALRPLMIVSNCQQGYVEIFLETSGLGGYFKDFECWGNTGLDKSSNLRALIERNRLRSPWLVGDTEGDYEAAAENGVPFVYASYGFGKVPGCDLSIERFADLVGLVS